MESQPQILNSGLILKTLTMKTYVVDTQKNRLNEMVFIEHTKLIF